MHVHIKTHTHKLIRTCKDTLFKCHQRYKKSIQKEIRYLKKEKIRSPNDARKDYLKTWGLELAAARVNVLTHIGSWPTAIKLNPL